MAKVESIEVASDYYRTVTIRMTNRVTSGYPKAADLPSDFRAELQKWLADS